jgi:hypothetical protein
VTAAYDNPGPLDPPGLPHHYFVTPVQPGWSEEQADQWLRHLNLACLENVSVHEVSLDVARDYVLDAWRPQPAGVSSST